MSLKKKPEPCHFAEFGKDIGRNISDIGNRPKEKVTEKDCNKGKC
jgi:hypothetical protein